MNAETPLTISIGAMPKTSHKSESVYEDRTKVPLYVHMPSIRFKRTCPIIHIGRTYEHMYALDSATRTVP